MGRHRHRGIQIGTVKGAPVLSIRVVTSSLFHQFTVLLLSWSVLQRPTSAIEFPTTPTSLPVLPETNNIVPSHKTLINITDVYSGSSFEILGVLFPVSSDISVIHRQLSGRPQPSLSFDTTSLFFRQIWIYRSPRVRLRHLDVGGLATYARRCFWFSRTRTVTGMFRLGVPSTPVGSRNLLVLQVEEPPSTLPCFWFWVSRVLQTSCTGFSNVLGLKIRRGIIDTSVRVVPVGVTE